MKSNTGRGGSVLSWLSTFLMLAAAVTILVMGDRYWWTVPLLYGPRWVWGALLIGHLPIFWQHSFGAWARLLFSLALFLFGILDFRLGIGHLSSPDSTSLRVLEFNAEGDIGNPEKIQKLVAYITSEDPDVIVMPECSAKTVDTLKAHFKTYGNRTSYSLCMFTKGEIQSWEIRDPSDFWKRYGSAAIVRSNIAYKGKTFRIGLVHLATPRRALAKFNDSTQVESMKSSTTSNIVLRDDESASGRRWITEGDSLPTFIAGDFNLPVSSAIYRRHWGDLQNAFSSTGVGLGHTKTMTLWGIRIDQVLTMNGIKAVRAWVGPDLDSDHRPLRADLYLPERPN